MPQIEQIGTFLSQVFWLVVTFGVLYLLMWKVALPRVTTLLMDREERIDEDIRKAEEARTEAEKAREAYELAVADAAARAQAMIREIRQQQADENARRMDELEARIRAEAEAAEQRIEAARAQAAADIREVATEVAQAATSRLITVDVAAEDAEAAVLAVMEERT